MYYNVIRDFVITNEIWNRRYRGFQICTLKNYVRKGHIYSNKKRIGQLLFSSCYHFCFVLIFRAQYKHRFFLSFFCFIIIITTIKLIFCLRTIYRFLVFFLRLCRPNNVQTKQHKYTYTHMQTYSFQFFVYPLVLSSNPERDICGFSLPFCIIIPRKYIERLLKHIWRDYLKITKYY